MGVGASAQDLTSKDELYEGKEFANAFADPPDNPDLPNILLIGDSISNAYTVDVRKLLVGKADVFRIPSNGKYASFGSKNLDKWLGNRKWDVIHFNWGLWDICYRNPKSKTQGHRDKVNGTLTATPDQYRESMEKIVARLKKTEATLIWCTTTPVPEHEAGRKMGDEIKYNAIAASIMLKNDILINDLHAHALKRLPEIQKKKGDVHFTSAGSAYLAEQVARSISVALKNDDTQRLTKRQSEKKPEKHSWTLGYTPDKTVAFSEPAEGKPLKLDCFFPSDHKAGGNNGCIILFFGGGWSSGDTSQFYGYGKYFASRGLVAISAQYRTRKSHKASPRNCVEDGKDAIRYVRSRANEFGIDPNKIIVGGGSAGGHVAAACAMCPKIDASPESEVSNMPNALMLFNPVYDNGPKGYGHDRVKAYWRDISPMQNIRPDLPPTIVFFGDRDKHVPVTAINAFQRKMEGAGNQSETYIYKGQTHGFFHISKGGRKMFEDVLTQADAFLVKNGFITGKDNVLAWTTDTIANLPAKSKKKQKNRKGQR